MVANKPRPHLEHRVGIAQRNARFLRQFPQLVRRAVDQDEPDAQRAQDSEIGEDVGEIIVGDDRAIERDHERLFPETGNVG